MPRHVHFADAHPHVRTLPHRPEHVGAPPPRPPALARQDSAEQRYDQTLANNIRLAKENMRKNTPPRASGRLRRKCEQ